jgi:hypothetical protein
MAISTPDPDKAFGRVCMGGESCSIIGPTSVRPMRHFDPSKVL